MKELIAVWGVANVGKTKSIKRAYKKLRDAYPDAEVEEFWVGADITVVIAKIGIESRGDPLGDKLRESFRRFAEIGCQLIICATRTYGSTCKVVREFCETDGYEVKWIEKRRLPPEEWEADIEATAESIFHTVQTFLHD